MRQIPLDLGPTSMPQLDQFVPGRNIEALTWLRHWPDVDSPRSPAYFWGGQGAGKTHLLRAMIEPTLARGWGVIWLNAHTCQMWDAEATTQPTLALIDECEALDPSHQHLAFNLFIESASSQASLLPDLPPDASPDATATGPLYIIAAGAMPAVDLPVRDDLRTRLGWGLTFALSTLDENGLRAALLAEASRRGVALSDDLLSYLLTRHSRDLAFLMNLLDRLDRYALAEHRVLTVPLLKQMLAAETP
ncbi:MAG: DnaA regulatory inactivator Hda [Aquabacterium sp.]|jgi:DnaA family protein|uniref:HdaA/DnaA family protein n=1 Tax=Aquabacterium sp. TaxID=1872578 RepID=UPI001B7407A9|nr:DnaA regulatory inactivator Hda [Aquabacterium sp.]MBP7132375.1 DnaA regulatory inactivator Hda [Aquabacterium sp.]MBP9063333.1 DnaA regulatory inactivator Hda [Aquabacterium sp.]MDQ5926394.1 Bac DnaA protein [Pseudomonadota bacterium]